jgi:hypothetical protein
MIKDIGARVACLAFWLGGPAISYVTGGPVNLLCYLVLLGLYGLFRDAWHILRGDL